MHEDREVKAKTLSQRQNKNKKTREVAPRSLSQRSEVKGQTISPEIAEINRQLQRITTYLNRNLHGNQGLRRETWAVVEESLESCCAQV
jgi:uncharacterized FlaG/YvyC family protein